MGNYRIATLNKISKTGLACLTGDYDLTEDIDTAEAIIVRSYKMHDMEFSPNLLAIGRAGAGVNNIPLERCAESGIAVFNSPGANANAVKEICIAAMIIGARNLFEGIKWVNSLDGDVPAEIESGKKQFAGTEIFGKTLGIIGLGNIGARLANAAHSLGMKVVGNSVFVDPILTAPCDMYDDLNEMIKVCDFVSIHVPSLPETKGMINKNLLNEMKDATILLNFARPDLVVNADIIEACESGKLYKYITDVPNEELIDKKNIVCTPHLGASTEEAEDNCASMASMELMDFLENGNIRNSVNFPSVHLDDYDNTVRVSFMYREENGKAKELIENALGKENIVDISIGSTRGKFGYALAAIKAGTDTSAAVALEGSNMIRVRVLDR